MDVKGKNKKTKIRKVIKMKNTKALKIFTIILSVALLVIGAVATTVSAEEAAATPKVEIVSKNLSYTSEISIMFAVKAENIGENAVELNVYDKDPAKNPDATVKYTVTASYTETINAYGECLVFFTEGIPAKAIEQEIYVQAVAGNAKSDFERYSIVEYCHEMNAKKDTDLYTNIITYGATIQQMLKDDGKFDGEYATAYKYVTIENGTLDGTYDSGIYLKNETVTPYAEGAEYWSDGNKVVANGATYTVGDSNVAFTAASAKELYTENFDDGTLPSTITALTDLSAAPSVKNQAGTYPLKAPTVGVNSSYSSYNNTNSLYFKDMNRTNGAVLKISEMSAAPENANAVEFEANMLINWASTSSANREFLNIVFTKADGTVAYNLVLRNTAASTSGTNLGIATRTESTVTGNCTFIQTADGTKYFNVRVVYTNTADGISVEVYCDDQLKQTHTVLYDGSTVIDSADITNAYIYINTNSDASADVLQDIIIDDLWFGHVVE